MSPLKYPISKSIKFSAQAENNALHLQIIEAVEAAEIWEASIRQNLQNLEDEIDSTKLALQHENRRSAQKEVELQQLQMEAATMLGIDDGNAKPCDSLPDRSTFQLDAEPLMAKEESLSESLYQCRKTLSWQFLKLETCVAPPLVWNPSLQLDEKHDV